MERWSIFNIFLHAAFALTHSRILPPLCLSNGQWGQTGELEVEKGGKKKGQPSALKENWTTTQAEGGFILLFAFGTKWRDQLGREQLFCYPIPTLIITTGMSLNWFIPDDNQIFSLSCVKPRCVHKYPKKNPTAWAANLKSRQKFSAVNSLEAPALKKQSDGIVTLSMHPSMLTPRCRQTEGMARLDNQVRVC